MGSQIEQIAPKTKQNLFYISIAKISLIGLSRYE